MPTISFPFYLSSISQTHMSGFLMALDPFIVLRVEEVYMQIHWVILEAEHTNTYKVQNVSKHLLKCKNLRNFFTMMVMTSSV